MNRENKQVRKFDSFREAEEAYRAFYRSFTPEQRVDILLELIARHGPIKRLERVYRIVKLEQKEKTA